MSNNTRSENFPSNESYSLFQANIEHKGEQAELVTMEMHGQMTFDTLNPVLTKFSDHMESEARGRTFLYFTATPDAKIGTPMTNIQLTQSIGNPKTPMGRFVRVLGKENVPILNRTSDSGINWLIGAVASVAKTMKIKLNVIDIPHNKTAEDMVKQIMEG